MTAAARATPARVKIMRRARAAGFMLVAWDFVVGGLAQGWGVESGGRYGC